MFLKVLQPVWVKWVLSQLKLSTKKLLLSTASFLVYSLVNTHSLLLNHSKVLQNFTW